MSYLLVISCLEEEKNLNNNEHILSLKFYMLLKII